MRFLTLLGVLTFAYGCSSPKGSYREPDYAYSCTESKDNEYSNEITDICVPIDTYEEPIHYYSTKPYQYRKMKNLDDARDEMED